MQKILPRAKPNEPTSEKMQEKRFLPRPMNVEGGSWTKYIQATASCKSFVLYNTLVKHILNFFSHL